MTSRGLGFRAAAAVVAAAAGTPALALPPASPAVTNPATGNTYYLTAQGSWTNAAMDAVALGGHLLTVNDAAENAWVVGTFGSYGGQQRLLWTGLHDVAADGQFRYLSGQTPSYTNWAPGEPNGGNNEFYAAIYYPNHSSGGQWNDWGQGAVSDPIGLPFNGVAEVDASRPAPRVLAQTDTSWRAIAPVGDLTGQPIGNVGLAWEAAHPGWRTDPNFDTAGWSDPVASGHGIWVAGSNSPGYFRQVITLTDVPSQAMMLANADDDALIYINGTLVVSDTSGLATEFGPLDVRAYLRSGTNLIAVKAQDTGGIEAFRLMIYDQVPEPGSAATAGLAAAGLLSGRRRARCRRGS